MENKDKSLISNIIFFIVMIGVFNVFPPFGILMLLSKLGVFKKRTNERNISSDSRQTVRMDKYRIMTEGRSAESIEYLASAVGVSYDTALRDLQKMVADGMFGPQAYINYVDRTVVLTPGATAARTTYTPPKNRPAGNAAGSNMVSRAKATGQEKTGSKAKTNAKDQSYDGLRKFLLIAGIVLLVLGIAGLTEPLDWRFWLSLESYSMWEFFRDALPGLLMAGSGVGSLLYRGSLKKRSNRFKVYEAACTGRDFIPIAELASKAGVNERKCRKDLEAMLEKGMLTATAYIDQGDGMLILKPGASPKVEDDPEPPKDDEDRYRAIIREIRALNDAIPDPDVSRRIDEMENLTSAIFRAVQDKPEKEPQIKSFMSYYLPTTLKLLRSYADFEQSGATGENIRSAKLEIERILDTLVDGFRKQLDKLYEADAMDISSDIDVLETMLRRDGLTGDGSAFGAQTGGKR